MFTARDLVGGLLIGVTLGALVDASGKALPTLFRGLSIIVTGSVLLLTGRWWGRDIAHLVAASNLKVVDRVAALTFGPVVVAVALALAGLEPMMVRRGAGSGLAIHVVYSLLFVLATLLIAAAAAFALGWSLHGRAFGVRLAIGAGIAAAVAFLAADLLMDVLGWRVGAPEAGKRATMLVVTAVGALAAALSAGGAIGALLPLPQETPS